MLIIAIISSTDLLVPDAVPQGAVDPDVLALAQGGLLGKYAYYIFVFSRTLARKYAYYIITVEYTNIV